SSERRRADPAIPQTHRVAAHHGGAVQCPLGGRRDARERPPVCLPVRRSAVVALLALPASKAPRGARFRAWRRPRHEAWSRVRAGPPAGLLRRRDSANRAAVPGPAVEGGLHVPSSAAARAFDNSCLPASAPSPSSRTTANCAMRPPALFVRG